MLSFIKNPVKGGSPALFNIRTSKLIEKSVKKIGNVEIMYIRKYVKAQDKGLVMIHPTCNKPEKKRRIKMSLAPIAHLDATNILHIKTICNIDFEVESKIRKIGAIFCHVKNNAAVSFVKLDTRAAPQK